VSKQYSVLQGEALTIPRRGRGESPYRVQGEALGAAGRGRQSWALLGVAARTSAQQVGSWEDVDVAVPDINPSNQGDSVLSCYSKGLWYIDGCYHDAE
jgi:hypothetical protein